MNILRTTGISPVWRKLILAAAMAGAVTATTGCVFSGSGDGGAGSDQWSDVEPDEEGLYAYNGDDLVRLDGDAEWEKETWGERSGLSPHNEFIIRDDTLEEFGGAASDVVGVRKVAWVRSSVNENGEITPVTGSQWQSAPLPSLTVPLDYAERSESNQDLIRVRPRRPLEPGLYAIYLDTGEGARKARFGVAWPETDKQAYASSVCVDRYVGDSTGYRLCGEQASSQSGDPLQIYLVQPETRTVGSGRTMVISGVILNNSSSTQQVPLLTAVLRDASGQPLTSWRFKAAGGQLEPGQSTSFRTEVENASQQVHSVNVNFASTQASN